LPSNTSETAVCFPTDRTSEIYFVAPPTLSIAFSVAHLPVQLPSKFLMAVNIKTAKALGLTISASFLLRADEVIE
jgi:hypothetical protein